MAELKHLIPIKATAGKVYDAVATEKGLKGWWTADAHAEEKAGGKAEFGFENHSGVFRMKIEELVPGKRVVWSCHGDQPEWEGTRLTWTITEKDGTSVLHFTHSGWKSMSDYCIGCNSTWGELMYRIKDYVEGKQPGPHWKK